MAFNEEIRRIDLSKLAIIHYPDPRLRQMSVPVDTVDDAVRRLVARMWELMFEGKGVGLAAPQVGLNVRLFVASPSFDPADRRVYINPEIINAEGQQNEEEGCLSLPGLSASIKRYAIVRLAAINLDGEKFEETGEELTARMFQHEIDHLDGRLFVDRLGSVARMARRKALKELEDKFPDPQ